MRGYVSNYLASEQELKANDLQYGREECSIIKRWGGIKRPGQSVYISGVLFVVVVDEELVQVLPSSRKSCNYPSIHRLSFLICQLLGVVDKGDKCNNRWRNKCII